MAAAASIACISVVLVSTYYVLVLRTTMDQDSGKKDSLDPTIDFIAGTVAGIAALVAGHPLDTVKVRFQSPQWNERYNRGTFNALATIVREERFSGLYKGVTSPLVSFALLSGLLFSSYRFLVKIQVENENSIPTIAQVTLAGIGCGMINSFITAPTELIKTRQQSLLTPSSTWAVTMQILKSSGIRGLYRGLTATFLRDTSYGAYFASYELSCRFFAGSPLMIFSAPSSDLPQPPAPSLQWTYLLVAGGIAGVIGWLATFPMDVVKTRVQGTEWSPRPSATIHYQNSLTSPTQLQSLLTSQTSPRPSTISVLSDIVDNPYRTTRTTIVNSYRAEGLGVFYRGLAPTLIKAIPANMVLFGAFEGVVRLLS